MKAQNKFKALALCSVFALAALTGCDKLPGHKAADKAPAATTTSQTVTPPPAATQPASQPAPVVAQPAAPAKPAEPVVDERTFSEGFRVGHVVKFSFKSSPVAKYEEGDLLQTCKNWEGELSMENADINGTVGGSSTGNTFAFSVGKGRTDINKQLKSALEGGYKVRLQYNQVVHHDECKSRTDYYIVGVKNLEPKPAQPTGPK